MQRVCKCGYRFNTAIPSSYVTTINSKGERNTVCAGCATKPRHFHCRNTFRVDGDNWVNLEKEIIEITNE